VWKWGKRGVVRVRAEGQQARREAERSGADVRSTTSPVHALFHGMSPAAVLPWRRPPRSWHAYRCRASMQHARRMAVLFAGARDEIALRSAYRQPVSASCPSAPRARQPDAACAQPHEQPSETSVPPVHATAPSVGARWSSQ